MRKRFVILLFICLIFSSCIPEAAISGFSSNTQNHTTKTFENIDIKIDKSSFQTNEYCTLSITGKIQDYYIKNNLSVSIFEVDTGDYADFQFKDSETHFWIKTHQYLRYFSSDEKSNLNWKIHVLIPNTGKYTLRLDLGADVVDNPTINPFLVKEFPISVASPSKNQI